MKNIRGELQDHMIRLVSKVKEIPYLFKLRSGFATALNKDESYKKNAIDIYYPPMQKVPSYFNSCNCCLCNQCDCCLFSEWRGRKCDAELCECRYRKSVYCTTAGKRYKYPRNKPLPDSTFLLDRMEEDRRRDREMKERRKL